MKKMSDMIGGNRILPILVVSELETVLPACRAVIDAGIDCIEIVLRSKDALLAIEQVSIALPDMRVGGGTVLTLKQAQQVLDAGGRFIVSPGFDAELATFCIAKEIPYLPGCVTAGEIQQALKFGLDILKFFPAFEFGGIHAMQMYSGPFPGVKFIPTGGVNADNLGTLYVADNVTTVGGAWMFTKENALATHNYRAITENLRKDISSINQIVTP